MGPKPNLLCDDRLATDGIGASDRQHPVQDRHADDSLGLLGSEAAGPQTWSDQRLVRIPPPRTAWSESLATLSW